MSKTGFCGKYQKSYENTGKIKKIELIFFFKLKGKRHKPSQAENPSARAMAPASLAHTHH